MKRVAYFISGEGRLALCCINFVKAMMSETAENALIVYSGECNAVRNISSLNIESHIIQDNWKLNREKICNEICDLCLENNVDFIVMTFCKLLTGRILVKYKSKIINLHPSLLPSFKGMHPIEQALDFNSRFIGATTHFIDENMDEGVVLCQGIIPVGQNEDISKIKERHFQLLKGLYLNTIWFYITDSIQIANNRAMIENSCSNSSEINPIAITDIIDIFLDRYN